MSKSHREMSINNGIVVSQGPSTDKVQHKLQLLLLQTHKRNRFQSDLPAVCS